jgi:hypothetical protein
MNDQAATTAAGSAAETRLTTQSGNDLSSDSCVIQTEVAQ